MADKKQELVRKSALPGVFYVYNNKFNKSPKKGSLEGKMTSQKLNRNRILSDKDVNCCDKNVIRPRKVKFAEAVNIEGQENACQIDNPETAGLTCKRKIKQEIATNGTPLNKKYRGVLPCEVHKKNAKPSNKDVKYEEYKELTHVNHCLEIYLKERCAAVESKSAFKSKDFYLECNINAVSDLILCSGSYIEDFVINMLKEEQNTNCGYNGTTSQKEFQNFIEMLLPLQDRYGLWLHEVYTAIHIFLVSIELFKTSFDINAIVSVSILLAHKVAGASNKSPSLKSILRFCNVDYRRKVEVLSAERMILQSLRYHIFQPDPLTFVLYYILKLQLDSPKLIWSCSNFILSSAILKISVHAIAPSKIAAATVLLSLAYMRTKCEWVVLESFPAFYPESTLYPVCCILQECINLVHMHYGEFLTFKQYNSEKYDFIAEKIVKEMIL